MARPTPLSGFPEWLPAGRLVEHHIIETLRRTFELHGFAGIETRAVEPLDQLLRKGETSKEVYVLRRLQEESGAAEERAGQLALHFDLTVPFARYVLENAGHLSFPFKRYQIQKVWRGSDRRTAVSASSCRRTSTSWAQVSCRTTSRSSCRSSWPRPSRRSRPSVCRRCGSS
ncbi:hypothetical protein LJB74_19510 [Cellulomonas sp. P24]|nr:hypothetical protein [Cellulomonas sp. P24]